MARGAPHNRLRIAGRLAIGFALDVTRMGSFGRDVVDALLVVAISQANIAQISRNHELQRRYAGLDQTPPDELRRPVSVSAVANSLRIPFETARRRVATLIELGAVRTAPRGVIVPAAALDSPFYRMAAEGNYALVRNLYLRLRSIGLLEDLPRPAASTFDPEHPPVRLVMRVASDYLLRLADRLSAHIGDAVTALVWIAVLHANTEHLPENEGGVADENWTSEGFVIDERRKPVRIATIAERLGIAPETVRRHLIQLVKDDRCERTSAGYVIPSRVLARDPVVQYLMDNQSHLQRLFAGLSDYGVLSQWEQEHLALRGAA